MTAAVEESALTDPTVTELFMLGLRMGRQTEAGRAGCILWTGGKNPNGYAGIHFRGKWRAAHRVAYLIAVGPVPEGLELDHLCHNRDCINPEHMEPVTHEENMRRQVRPFIGICKNGHQRTVENTRTDGRGHRRCLDCDRDSARRTHARRRAARAGGKGQRP